MLMRSSRSSSSDPSPSTRPAPSAPGSALIRTAGAAGAGTVTGGHGRAGHPPPIRTGRGGGGRRPAQLDAGAQCYKKEEVTVLTASGCPGAERTTCRGVHLHGALRLDPDGGLRRRPGSPSRRGRAAGTRALRREMSSGAVRPAGARMARRMAAIRMARLPDTGRRMARLPDTDAVSLTIR